MIIDILLLCATFMRRQKQPLKFLIQHCGKSSLHTVMGKGSDLAGTVPNLPTVVVEKEINCSTLNKITLGNCIVTYDRGS